MREQSNQRDWNNPKDHVLTIGVSTRALFDMEKKIGRASCRERVYAVV